MDSCVPPQGYSGPDSQNASVSGSCVDQAGNTSVRAFALSYDGTAPQAFGVPARQPDSNGWYNQAIRVAFDGTDATSGIDSCTAPQVYSGPDAANASLSGDCTDRAGNISAVAMSSFGYDATAPQVTATPGRAPDANGWYNHALTVSLQRRGRNVGRRQLHAGHLLGPGQPDRLRRRLLPRPSRQRGHREHRGQVRRDRACGHAARVEARQAHRRADLADDARRAVGGAPALSGAERRGAERRLPRRGLRDELPRHGAPARARRTSTASERSTRPRTRARRRSTSSLVGRCSSPARASRSRSRRSSSGRP